MANNLMRIAVRSGHKAPLIGSSRLSHHEHGHGHVPAHPVAAVDSLHLPQDLKDKIHPKVGNRDIVGFGINGMPGYMDAHAFPCPSIRFKPNSSDVMALRQKEKGDWKALSIDEKKALYRASFRKTFAEINAPTGEWKNILAIIFAAFGVTGVMVMFAKHFVLPPMPHTITKEWQEEQVHYMILQRQGAVTGISSHFDYDKNDWK